jgi:predicted RNA polymerase sigma factor
MSGLTVSEMAQILGVKENAIKQRIRRAKQRAIATAVYSHSTFETIKSMSKVGRPKKEDAGESGSITKP